MKGNLVSTFTIEKYPENILRCNRLFPCFSVLTATELHNQVKKLAKEKQNKSETTSATVTSEHLISLLILLSHVLAADPP